MHHILSDRVESPCANGFQDVALRVIVVGLMISCTPLVGAQPVQSSEIPRRILPSDPVGNLFNDGPRVVYTQEAGADPIERLFWDRELKKEKLRQESQESNGQQPQETSEPSRPVVTQVKSKSDQASNTAEAEATDTTTKPSAGQKLYEEKTEPSSESRSKETALGQNTKQSPLKDSADPSTQSVKRAADAGKVDGIRINGAQWPVNSRPKNAYGKKRAEGRPWQGLVFDVPVGTHVKSIDAGRVMYANEFKNYGNLVIIDHGDRIASVYANNQRLLVKEGDLIGTGDLIAISGQTGSLDYPALYFEIRKEGKPVDPTQFLKRR